MKQKKLCIAISGLLSVSTMCIQAAQAGGKIIIVDSFNDVPEAGLTTLREAIEEINSQPEFTIDIGFDEEVFSEPRVISLVSGDLQLTTSTGMFGPGADLLTIDAQNLSRVLTINDGTSTVQNVTISGITFTNGNGTSSIDDERGGCIASKESLRLENSVVSGCDAPVDGGGVWSLSGQLSIIDSNITDNNARFKGGGVYSREQPALVAGSTISANTINSRGAGLFFESGGLVTNSTVSNNMPRSGGTGGIESSGGSLTVENSTVFNNDGLGVEVVGNNQLFMTNSIVAGHDSGDCEFTSISANSDNQNNLDSDGSCDVLATNHVTVADPMLSALTHVGGNTVAHRPLSGSPVIDSGDDSLCTEFDQRDVIRPQDGGNDGSAVCDRGAIEYIFELDELIFRNNYEAIKK